MANPPGFRTFLAAAVTGFPRAALRSSPSERTTFRTCEGNEGKHIRHGEQARGAERPLSSLRGLRSWIALRSSHTVGKVAAGTGSPKMAFEEAMAPLRPFLA